MKNFLVRSMTGIVLAILMLITVFTPPVVLFLVVLLLTSIGILELLSVFRKMHVRVNYWLPLVANLGLQLSLFFAQPVFTLMIFVAFIALSLIDMTFLSHRPLESYLSALFALIYVGMFLGHLLLIYPQRGVLFVFLTSWGTDTVAYLVGINFGKHKLAKHISPKKSIEGALGGVAGAVVLTVIYALFYGLQSHLFTLILIAMIASVLSQCGDLCASHFKRVAGVKDYSNLIRGHGGILDRFDSVLFAAPTVFYLSLLFGGGLSIL